jgi:hypothetical protein
MLNSYVYFSQNTKIRIMKIAIVGSRGFEDYDLLKSTMQVHQQQATLIISGGAKGADQLAEQWSKEFLNQLPLVIRPDWEDISHSDAILKYNDKGECYDARAGLRRNEQIAEKADLVIAFWDGQSKGTKQIVLYARQIGKAVEVIKYKEAAQLKFPF